MCVSTIPYAITSYHAMNFTRTLSNKLEGIDEAAERAASLPILLCHGKGMNLMNYSFSRD